MKKLALLLVLIFLSSVFTTLALGIPRLREVSRAMAPATSTGDCDSGESCVRVYKTLKDVESQSYKVVRFSEAEIHQAIREGVKRVHNKIVDETGFDCKKGKYEHGVFRCEEGALYTTHNLLINVLQELYG